MSKSAQIKKKILEARKNGDTEIEIRLLDELALLRASANYKSNSIKSAYGMMADSP